MQPSSSIMTNLLKSVTLLLYNIMANLLKSGTSLLYNKYFKRIEPQPDKPISTRNTLRIRMSVRELEKDEKKKNAFLRAWKIIQELPVDNPNSFWAIAGFHGEPFRDPLPNTNRKPQDGGWGGWCQHRNVLFPTWHRFYVLRLEQALRTVCPDDDIAMAYWDETSEESLKYGLPDLLTAEKVTIDGKTVDNPLKTFTFPEGIEENKASEYYHKPKGYKTVRYPLSGICSPPKAAKVAIKHNEDVMKLVNDDTTQLLNDNIKDWLNTGRPFHPKDRSVYDMYKSCLDVSSYNAFSNTSSSNAQKDRGAVSLESPHNLIHLAGGGFDIKDKDNCDVIRGANGDLGENETAGFDPLFFFHHCNIDRVFWIWQKKHGKTQSFDIDPDDKSGTNPSGQGPTPSQSWKENLTMDTPLAPFQHPNGVPATSRDCIDIINQLKYDYSIGSLDKQNWPAAEPVTFITKKIENFKELHIVVKKHENEERQKYVFDVTGIPVEGWSHTNFVDSPGEGKLTYTASRSYPVEIYAKVADLDLNTAKGSFLIRLYHKEIKTENLIGQEAILKRWKSKNCHNCQFHPTASGWFSLQNWTDYWPITASDIKAEIVYHDPDTGEQKHKEITLLQEGDTGPEQAHIYLYCVLESSQ